MTDDPADLLQTVVDDIDDPGAAHALDGMVATARARSEIIAIADWIQARRDPSTPPETLLRLRRRMDEASTREDDEL